VLQRFFVSQGAELKSTTSQALIQLTSSTITGADAQSGGHFFHVSDSFGGAPSSEVVSPASVTLAGPLLDSGTSTITSLFSLVRVQRSTLSSTTTSPLVTVSGGSVTLGGTNSITGSVTGSLLNVTASGSSGDVASAASISLAGPLASLTNTTFNSGSGDVVGIFNGATYTSTGTGAMLQLSSTGLTGFNLVEASGLGGAGGTTKASFSLAGPVLSATSSTLTLGSNVIGVFNGSTLTSTTTSPLVQLTGGSLTAGTSSFTAGTPFSGAALLQVNGGSSPGLVTLNGPVLSTSSSANTTISGALLGTFNGGQLVVNTSTDPLFAFTGGTHSFGTATGTDRDTALILRGLSTQTANATVSFTASGCDGPCSPIDVTINVGTRKPVQHSGALIEATGGTLTTNKMARVDTSLVEATAPLLSLKSGATMTVSNDAIDLIQTARINMTATANPLVRLDASTLTVSNGALIAARAGTLVTVAGNAIQLLGGATLNISNGPLVLVQAGSLVKVTGALISFGTGGGTINITNNLCASTCPTAGGLRYSVGSGATSSNVSLGSGTVAGSGTINYGSINSAAIRIEGTNARIMAAGGGS
jgi:hypothetical protein